MKTVVHALHMPRRDGSAYTHCGRYVRPATKSRGAKPVLYLTALGERYRAVRPGWGKPTSDNVNRCAERRADVTFLDL